MLFTHKEKTEKRHDVNFIMGQVRAVISDKKVQGLCMNKIPADNGQLYTTERASAIIAEVVDDSLYYAN
jgi:hypothetical protein